MKVGSLDKVKSGGSGCHSERSEESSGSSACEYHVGFFAVLRM